MTDIKIPFTKTRIISQETSRRNPANKWIDLEISTDYRMKQLEPRLDILHGDNPDNTFAKMRFVFLNNAEPDLYQALLDKTNFELSFDKEQIDYGVGGGGGPIDDTKPKVNLYQAPSSRMLEVQFSPQFAGVIKLTTDGQNPPSPQPRPTPPLSF